MKYIFSLLLMALCCTALAQLPEAPGPFDPYSHEAQLKTLAVKLANKYMARVKALTECPQYDITSGTEDLFEPDCKIEVRSVNNNDVHIYGWYEYLHHVSQLKCRIDDPLYNEMSILYDPVDTSKARMNSMDGSAAIDLDVVQRFFASGQKGFYCDVTVKTIYTHFRLVGNKLVGKIYYVKAQVPKKCF